MWQTHCLRGTLVENRSPISAPDEQKMHWLTFLPINLEIRPWSTAPSCDSWTQPGYMSRLELWSRRKRQCSLNHRSKSYDGWTSCYHMEAWSGAPVALQRADPPSGGSFGQILQPGQRRGAPACALRVAPAETQRVGLQATIARPSGVDKQR